MLINTNISQNLKLRNQFHFLKKSSIVFFLLFRHLSISFLKLFTYTFTHNIFSYSYQILTWSRIGIAKYFGDWELYDEYFLISKKLNTMKLLLPTLNKSCISVISSILVFVKKNLYTTTLNKIIALMYQGTFDQNLDY